MTGVQTCALPISHSRARSEGSRSPIGVFKQNENCIHVKKADVDRAKKAALRRGEDWLGTIHSHTDTKDNPTCWHLSKSDIKSALQWGETVCAIVFVDEEGSRSAVHWYIPAPIPKVIYDAEGLIAAIKS